jgi:hypothetical protein
VTVVAKTTPDTPTTKPTPPTPPAPPADDPSLCNCIGPWQQTILVQQSKAADEKSGLKSEYRVDIIKPWTYDPVKKGCVGTWVLMRNLYNPNIKQWQEQAHNGGTDAVVYLKEAREKCNALQK